MGAKFTVQQLMEATRAVALERPDYIANRYGENDCQYFSDDGTPDCVVGHGLARLGVTLADVGPANGNGVLTALHHLDVIGDVEWLLKVQFNQDRGASWGEAVRIADGEAPQ